MAPLQKGDSFPTGVTFDYVPFTPDKSGINTCGIPIKYNASEGKNPNPPRLGQSNCRSETGKT